MIPVPNLEIFEMQGRGSCSAGRIGGELRTGRLHRFCVADKGSGVASALAVAAEQRLARAGCVAVQIEPWPKMVEARLFAA